MCSLSDKVLLQPQLHSYLIHSNYTHMLQDKYILEALS